MTMTQKFTSEEEMLQEMVELIEKSTGLVLDQEHVKELLIEVQREQLKGLVYKAFMAVNQAREQPTGNAVSSEETA
jgi:uncharacterized protein YaaW (UPF0174 family)